MNFYYINNNFDDGKFIDDDLVRAIYAAWNIEANLYLETKNGWRLIFAPHENNEFNSKLLNEYGYKVVDGPKERQIIDISTGKEIKYSWDEIIKL